MCPLLVIPYTTIVDPSLKFTDRLNKCMSQRRNFTGPKALHKSQGCLKLPPIFENANIKIADGQLFIKEITEMQVEMSVNISHRAASS